MKTEISRNSISLEKRIVLLAALIGALQGLTGWIVSEYWPDKTQAGLYIYQQQPFLLACFSLMMTGGLCLQLFLKQHLNRRGWLMSLGTGVLFALISYWSLYQFQFELEDGQRYGRHGDMLFELFWYFLLLAYVLFPYLQSWSSRISGHFNYQDLFRHSWDNYFIVSVGLILAGVYWLLIVLWVSLFKIVDIEIFEDIFYHAGFIWVTILSVIGIGITIGINNEKIIGTLRSIALSICKFLMPLTAIITLLFTFTLLFVGLQPVWDTNHSTPILVLLIAANILFINGIVQDAVNVQYPGLLKKLVNLAIFMMPILALIAAYSTWLRIDQHGLSPQRVYSSLIIFVAFSYSLTYPWAVVSSKKQWLENIQRPNIVIGLLICFLVIITHSPVFDPLQLSAANQYQRLIEKDLSIEEFDFGVLQYKFGKPGRYYLKQIRDLESHPEIVKIRARLKLLDNTKSYYDWKTYLQGKDQPQKKKFKILSPHLQGTGAQRDIPDTFYQALKTAECISTCYLLFIDLNGDNQEEIIKLPNINSPYTLDVYTLQDERWKKIGQFNRVGSNKNSDSIELLLKNEGLRLIQQEYQNISIGDLEWDFRNIQTR